MRASSGTERTSQLRARAERRRFVERIRDWLDDARSRATRRRVRSARPSATHAGQWDALGRFLDDATLPLDNNASERALRVVALGRKNFLFVGHDEAGENLAGLYSLVATCEANGVNPVAYLATSCSACRPTRPRSIDELLPDRWTPPAPNTS